MEDDRKQSINETLKLLKGIKTLDDIKEHRKDIINAMINMTKSALDTLKSFFETMMNLSDEEKEEMFSKIQDDSFLFTKEVEDELDRLYSLPGADEYMDGFQQELEKQIGPYMEQLTEQMGKIMEQFMGDLMGGLAEGLGQMMGGGDEDDEQELTAEPAENERLDVGTIIYEIDSLETLKNNEKRIIKGIEDQLNADLYTMNYNKEIGMLNNDMVREGLMRISKRQKLLVRELDREFERIGKLPGAAEEAQAAKERIKNSLEPTVKQIKDILHETGMDD
jgi:hypothetical protein